MFPFEVILNLNLPCLGRKYLESKTCLPSKSKTETCFIEIFRSQGAIRLLLDSDKLKFGSQHRS